MGEQKFKTPKELKVNADNEGLYEEMEMAKDNAEKASPNRKTR